MGRKVAALGGGRGMRRKVAAQGEMDGRRFGHVIMDKS